MRFVLRVWCLVRRLKGIGERSQCSTTETPPPCLKKYWLFRPLPRPPPITAAPEAHSAHSSNIVFLFLFDRRATTTTIRLEIYSYWNQGGTENVLSMFLTLGDRYLLPPGTAPAPGEVRETPSLGLFHPSAGRYFSTPKEYLGWYEGEQEKSAAAAAAAEAAVAAAGGGRRGQHKVAPPGSPRVAVLLYRKHVVTKQGYISQMIR